MASPRVETPTGAPKQEARIEVDLGNMANIIGRIKEAPVCLDRTLQQESMSTDDLIKLAFHVETPRSSFCTALAFHSNAEPSVVSSSSSTASRESSTFSELDGSAGGGSISATPSWFQPRYDWSAHNQSKLTSKSCPSPSHVMAVKRNVGTPTQKIIVYAGWSLDVFPL